MKKNHYKIWKKVSLKTFYKSYFMKLMTSCYTTYFSRKIWLENLLKVNYFDSGNQFQDLGDFDSW